MTYRRQKGPWNPVGEKLTGDRQTCSTISALTKHLPRTDEWHKGSMGVSEAKKPYGSYGQLSVVYYESVKHADYVVYSYDTPIAWLTYGMWHMPDKKYSVSTSKHQGKISTALSVME